MSNIDVNQWIYDIRDLSFKKQNVYAYNSAFYATTFVRCVRGPIRL
ncbi:MAG: hypothetical protein LBF15_00935 [Candidatus Peribacteria bacterium]|jgi:hypothetical protein|nr:hypothetical protein [Candidatus Peribacteria bacterium]